MIHKATWWRYLFLFSLLLFNTLLMAAETDWGGALQAYLDGSNVPGREITVGTGLTFWVESDFNPSLTLAVAGGYSLQYDKGSVFQFPDLSKLALSGEIGEWSYQLGRFTSRDKERTLFNALGDGVSASWNGAVVDHRAGALFTGFVFNRTSRVIMTATDQRAFDNAGPFTLASPRVAVYWESVFHVLPSDGSLSLAVLGEADLRDGETIAADVPGSGTLHAGYLQAGVKGRLTPSLFYSAGLIGQAGAYVISDENRVLPVVAGLAEAQVSWFPSSSLRPVLSAQVLYSTGDTWNRSDWEATAVDPNATSLHQFVPFSTRTFGYVYGSRVGNLVLGRLGGSVTLVDSITISLDDFLFFRSQNGPVNEMPIEATDPDDRYLGNEVVLTAGWRPVSDFGLQVKGGIFFPNANVNPDGIQIRFGGTLSLSY